MKAINNKNSIASLTRNFLLIILVLGTSCVMAQTTKMVTKMCLDSTSKGTTYFYNEQGHNTESHYLEYNKIYYYEYNDKGQVISRTDYTMTDKINYMIEYTYNEKGYLIEENMQNNPCPSSNKPDECALVNAGRNKYIYDNEGKKTEYIWEYFDANNKIFKVFDRWEYTYDVKGNMIEAIKYHLERSGEWVQYDKITYLHDSIGNVIEMSSYYWRVSKNMWEESGNVQYEYTYLPETDKVVSNFVEDDDYNYKKIISEVKIKNKNKVTTITYYWSVKEIEVEEGETGIKSLSSQGSEIQVYPNPTTGQLTINNGQLTIDNVEVYDIAGKLVQTYRFNSSTKVNLDVSTLAKGAYSLSIYSEGQKTTKKFVKE